MNLNRAIIIGNLAADPEFRTTPNGQEVATIRVATNRFWTNQSGQRQEQTEFHRVVLWGRLANLANQYLTKGRLVMIEGRLQTRSWEGKDGIKRYQTEIVAENLQLGPRGQLSSSPSLESQTHPAASKISKKEFTKEDVPVVNEDEPPKYEEDMETTEVDLKDVPF